MKILVCTVAVIALTAADARAQMSMGSFKGYFTAHVGTLTGSDLDSERVSAGASVSVQEQSGWGAEVDFGRATDVVSNNTHLSLTNYSVNASWIQPRGVVRPFGVAGVTIMRLNNCCFENKSDYGLNAGAGVVLALHEVAGLRADVRYFYNPADHPTLRSPDRFAYLRFTIGATFMWDIAP